MGVLLVVALLAVAGIGCGKKKSARVRPPNLPASAAGAPAVFPGDAEYGYASWYGHPYHGRRTANGEVYDMHLFTAAHRTMPFGTEVEVTNMENGRQVRVRINDRGPFIDGRIIDLSLSAAKTIQLVGPGTALVEVKVLKAAPPGAGRAARTRPGAAPATAASVPPGGLPAGPSTSTAVSAARRPPATAATAANGSPPPPESPGSPPAAPVASVVVVPGRFTVQVGAFADPLNAERLRDELARRYPYFVVNTSATADGAIHRVWVANEPSEERARAVADLLRDGGLSAFVIRLD